MIDLDEIGAIAIREGLQGGHAAAGDGFVDGEDLAGGRLECPGPRGTSRVTRDVDQTAYRLETNGENLIRRNLVATSIAVAADQSDQVNSAVVGAGFGGRQEQGHERE